MSSSTNGGSRDELQAQYREDGLADYPAVEGKDGTETAQVGTVEGSADQFGGQVEAVVSQLPENISKRGKVDFPFDSLYKLRVGEFVVLAEPLILGEGCFLNNESREPFSGVIPVGAKLTASGIYTELNRGTGLSDFHVTFPGDNKETYVLVPTINKMPSNVKTFGGPILTTFSLKIRGFDN